MIILCSNGLSSPGLKKAAGRYVQPGEKAALVVTADPVYREKNRHVERCREELASLGLRVELLDLDFQPAQDLLRYDVVAVIPITCWTLSENTRPGRFCGRWGRRAC